ncbi:MAG: prepilin-type N-terminal cleavage/methylation domain-containing protein [Verrucomicrobiales bacterium]|jgi:prepilin-type N-terminal cleavage/methylation domain-containing protein
MKAAHQTNTNRNKHGFSLVEMLVVIAILGIITAIAVPMVASATERAGEASHHRNAQILATMATNAMAAGNLTIPDAGTVEEVVNLLIEGVSGTGVFDTTDFQVNILKDAERLAALELLVWEGGTLQYVPG